MPWCIGYNGGADDNDTETWEKGGGQRDKRGRSPRHRVAERVL